MIAYELCLGLQAKKPYLTYLRQPPTLKVTMEWMQAYLSYEGHTVWGMPVVSFIYSIAILLAIIGLRRTLLSRIFNYAQNRIQKTNLGDEGHLSRGLIDAVNRLSIVIGLYCAVYPFPLRTEVNIWLYRIMVVATLIIVYLSISEIIEGSTRALIRSKKIKTKALESFIPLIQKALRLILGLLFILVILSTFGYEAKALIGALGLGSALGGAALAFASKDALSNLLASISLALDRPFVVGDHIGVGGKYEGQVEEVGLRSTLVRTFEKTILTIPNGVLANEVINNYSRRPKRRVRHALGLTYGTTPEQMEALIKALKEVILSEPDVDPDFHLVSFSEFNSSSLDILIQYFTKNVDLLGHHTTLHRVNLAILKTVNAHGLSIAFPTRTLHHVQEPPYPKGD